jgi:hypothetical protein
MQFGNLGSVALVSPKGCDSTRLSEAQFGPLIGSGQPLLAGPNTQAIDQVSWVLARTAAYRTTEYNTADLPTLENDRYGSPCAALRFEGVFSRLRIDCVDWKWDVGSPLAPAPANTPQSLEVAGPLIQMRIRLGLNLAGMDPAIDVDYTPPIFRVKQSISDYGSLVNISGIPFNYVFIYARIPQNQAGFLPERLTGLAGFQVYCDLNGSTSRVLAHAGQYATVTSMLRSFERNTNLP